MFQNVGGDCYWERHPKLYPISLFLCVVLIMKSQHGLSIFIAGISDHSMFYSTKTALT